MVWVDRDVNSFSHRPGSFRGRDSADDRQHVMGFIDDKPMRTSCSGAEGAEVREQAGEKFGSVFERDSQEVYRQIHPGIFENGEDLRDVWFAPSVAEGDQVRKGT